MKVVILSQGPTLPLWADIHSDGVYDLTIGVNRVPEQNIIDWWCFADYTGFKASCRAEGIENIPHLFSKHDITSELANDADCADALPVWQEVKKRAIFEDDLRPLPAVPETPWKRMKYSGLYALWLAWHLEATEVDCYGVDLGGDRDFLGGRNESRGPDRWARERSVWYAMCRALEDAGVTIRMARMAPWGVAEKMHEPVPKGTEP